MLWRGKCQIRAHMLRYIEIMDLSQSHWCRGFMACKLLSSSCCRSCFRFIWQQCSSLWMQSTDGRSGVAICKLHNHIVLNSSSESFTKTEGTIDSSTRDNYSIISGSTKAVWWCFENLDCISNNLWMMMTKSYLHWSLFAISPKCGVETKTRFSAGGLLLS